MKPVFPFTAVVGQQPVKTALLLSLVDPLIGGVLVSGSRGSAKSTLVRSVQSLVPGGALVTLPLGATDEMLTGSIDLQQALQTGGVAFRPGLLARAHDGLLYVDEVNLLPDHLVDLLLDVSASGINHVERDGVSHEHEARFILIGSMNPDEGELRPQLQDRFGLLAPVQDTFSLRERRQIVAERLAFDEAPAAQATHHGPATDELAGRLRQARGQLASVAVSDRVCDAIAERCSEAGVEGLRADIILYRACRAHAALAGRPSASTADLDAVEELVLAHRRRDLQPPGSAGRARQDQPLRTPDASDAQAAPDRPASEPSGSREKDLRSGSDDSTGSRTHTPLSDSVGTTADAPVPQGKTDNHGRTGASIRGAWGAMPAVPVESSPPTDIGLPPTPVNQSLHRHSMVDSGPMPALATARSVPGGSTASPGTVHSRTQGSQINWFRTLTDNDNLARRTQGGTPPKLQFRQQRHCRTLLDIVLLDTSGSTLAGQGLSRAKGVIRHLSRQAYLGRRHLALIVFGNEQVRTLLTPTRAPKHIEPLLAGVQGGGGTPLGAALQVVNSMLRRLQHRPIDSRLYLLTDARVRDLRELPRCQASSTLLVDIESSGIRLGCGEWLAEAMGAHYIRVDKGTATS